MITKRLNQKMAPVLARARKFIAFRKWMKAAALLLFSVWLLAFSTQRRSHEPLPGAPKASLSDYAFFAGPLADLQPTAQVFAYDVNAPLFSDYAGKARFIALPAGVQMTYRADAAFEFPVGAVIIKNFYYLNDAAKPESGRRILETRLLLREANDWKALVYVWNTEQTDALLEVAGSTLPVQWKSAAGKLQKLDYSVPNLNQCKGCHSYDGQFVPIGITARQLNRPGETNDNQLVSWQKLGYLAVAPDVDLPSAPRLTDYRLSDPALQRLYPNLPATEYTTARARSYLDANCAHCHNPHGPASTSGMFLGIQETDLEKLGVGKPPVAAGRGSGNRRYGIVPGKPNESILVYRMESDDPGIRMPELGRQVAHTEGLEVVRAWIREMK